MSLASIDGHRVVEARVQIPAWGAWWADVLIDEEIELAGALTLTLADLELVGTIVSGGAYQGESRYRLVAGAGGWGRELEAKSYANDLGVKLSTVLGDAARAAGETLDLTTLPATTLGPAYVRPKGPASRLLELHASEAWYIDEAGLTRLGARTGAEIAADAAVRQKKDLARGTIALAADSIAEILPGATIDELVAVDVRHELEGGKLRSTVWAAGPVSTSRRLAALRRLLRQLLPDYRYRGTVEYRIVTQVGERLNLQPVLSSLGMPTLRNIRIRPGVPGVRADLVLGSTVLVTFVNADPGRPVVVAFEDAESDGYAPTRLDLVGKDDLFASVPDPTGRVLRYGDQVTIGIPPATQVTGAVLPGAAGDYSRVRA